MISELKSKISVSKENELNLQRLLDEAILSNQSLQNMYNNLMA